MRYLFLIFLLTACGATPAAEQPAPTAALRQVTIDGRDRDGSIIDPINLWDGYPAHAGVLGTVRHGTTVSLISQASGGCYVRTTEGVVGWVTCSNFIKEFK
jgi:hypothetical protein